MNIFLSKNMLWSLCESYSEVGKYFCCFLCVCDVNLCLLLFPSLVEKTVPTWSPAAVSFIALGYSFIRCWARLWVPFTKLGCSVCWLLNTSQLLLCGPKHMFRNGSVSICAGTRPSVRSGPLPPCTALCPSAWPVWPFGHAPCVSRVCPLAGGPAPLLAAGTRKESVEGVPPVEPSWGWALARTSLSVQRPAEFPLPVWALSVWKMWKCQGIIFASKKDGSRCENRFSHHNVNWRFVFILVEQYIGIHNIWL